MSLKCIKGTCMIEISKYFEATFSKFQCGFRKGYDAQHCLIAMIEKGRQPLTIGVFLQHD